MLQESSTPVLIDVGEAAAGAATEEITVADVLVSAFSFTGVIIVVAVLLAVAFAGGLIWLRKLNPTNSLNGEETERTRLDLNQPSTDQPG